jgi:hypothetical protein
MMSIIYGCATLTIVALSGQSSNAGLPGVSSPRRMPVKETVNGRTLFTMPSETSAELDTSLWITRAWTLQERFLSTRILYFSDTQVWFDCLEGELIRYQTVRLGLLVVVLTSLKLLLGSPLMRKHTQSTRYPFMPPCHYGRWLSNQIV